MRIQTILMAVALAGCGIETETDDIDTTENESASSVYQWAWKGYVPNQKSEWQVGMAYYNGRLQMVHNGHGDPHQLWMSSFNGSSWSPNVILPNTQRSDGGPALTVHGGQLKMIYRPAAQNRLVMSTFNGSSYGTPVTIGSYLGSETLTSEPAATVFNGQLYVGYCTQHKLRVDRFNGSSWSLAYSEPYASNGWCEHVELAVLPDDGALHVIVGTMADLAYGAPQYAMRDIRSFNGSTFAGSGQTLTMKTKQPISVVSCNGTTHMTHGGLSDSSEVWWSERMYGAWTSDFHVPNKYSWGGAALGCFGSRTIMVYPDTSGWLNWLEFGP